MDINERYLNNFIKLIQKETISTFDESDLTKFHEFHDILREVFPNVFKACEFKEFHGSFLLIWEGRDRAKKPVMIMNHHDVVEETGKWDHEPFGAEIADGKIWGRGTFDTKGGLWAMLQAADDLISDGYIPERDIYFESTCNEETTGHGAEEISCWMAEQGIELEVVLDEGGMIMYDPIGGAKGTFAVIGLGEKGCCDLKFSARSNGGHASMPPKDTPLVRLGKFMAEIEKKDPFDKEIDPTTRELFNRIAPYMGVIGFVLKHNKLFGGLIKAVMPKVSGAAGAMLKTTLAFTVAQGSNGNNVLPQEAFVIGNMRFSHHEGREKSIARLKPIADKYGIEIEILDPGFTSGISDFNGEGFRLVEQAVAKIFPNVDKSVPYILTGASDARYYDKVCKQCIRFLPFEIDDQQLSGMHGLNENINIDSLIPAVSFYKFFISNC